VHGARVDVLGQALTAMRGEMLQQRATQRG